MNTSRPTIPQLLSAIRLVQGEDLELCNIEELRIAKVIAQEFADMFEREIEERKPLPMFTWDEISCEITEWNGPKEEAEMDANSKESGFTFDSMLDNGVEVWKTDRHYGLNVRAANKEEAHQKFMAYQLYRELAEEDEEIDRLEKDDHKK